MREREQPHHIAEAPSTWPPELRERWTAYRDILEIVRRVEP